MKTYYTSNKSGRNDSGANGKVGGTNLGETTEGDQESGRNDSGARRKVGEATSEPTNALRLEIAEQRS